MGRFDGQVVLITGAASGIGKGIAEQFAANGANTVIVDYNAELGRRTADQLSSSGPRALFAHSDVSSFTAMAQVREQVFKEFGRIDVLVLNAGIAYRNTVAEISAEQWQQVININLTGLFTTVKAFYQDFLSNRGSIVYIGSGSAMSGTGGGVSYPAAKAGGEGLMRGLAKELGPKGVNVNTIAPRLIDSGEMMRVNYPTQEALDKALASIPVRRFGTVADVANLTLFLADKANSYLHGQTILLDGGRTVA